MRTSRENRLLNWWVLLALSVAAYLVGVGAVEYCFATVKVGDKNYIALQSCMPARVWQQFVGAQLATWVILIWTQRGDLDWRCPRYWAHVVAVIFALFAVWIPQLLDGRTGWSLNVPKAHGLPLGMALTVAGSAVGGLLAAGIPGVLSQVSDNSGISEFRAAQRSLRRQVTAISGLLALSVVSSAQVQRAVTECHIGSFPKELIGVYGGYLTALLALIYGPVAVQLQRIGRVLVEKSVQASSENLRSRTGEVSLGASDPDYLATLKIRTQLEGHLGLMPLDEVRNIAAVIAPVLSAALG